MLAQAMALLQLPLAPAQSTLGEGWERKAIQETNLQQMLEGNRDVDRIREQTIRKFL